MASSMNSIPIFRHIANEKLTKDICTSIERVVASNWYVLGDEVAIFEKQFAHFCGAKYCVSVANGTDALELALKSLGVTVDDTVFLAANAGFYGSTAVHLVGAKPIYIDICPNSLTLSAEKLQLALDAGTKPKAIIVTHLYGQLADIEHIVLIANGQGIPVIEDCAQSHGAKRNGKRAGSFGAISCFSFYPTKNLGALGDGGAITTNNENIFHKLTSLRQYGWNTKYHNNLQGGRNSRLDEIQAAVLTVKIEYLDQWNNERREIARFYNASFTDLPVLCPQSLDEDYVAHLYVLRTEKRNNLFKFLKKHNIGSDIHYPIADHLQSAYTCTQKKGSLPETEKACMNVISLPCFPGIHQQELEVIVATVKTFFRKIDN